MGRLPRIRHERQPVTRFHILQAPWVNAEQLRGQDTFLFTRVQSYGINNLESGAPLLDADLATRLQLDDLDPIVLAEAPPVSG